MRILQGAVSRSWLDTRLKLRTVSFAVDLTRPAPHPDGTIMVHPQHNYYHKETIRYEAPLLSGTKRARQIMFDAYHAYGSGVVGIYVNDCFFKEMGC